jgi:hypothetical protein
MTQEVQEKVYQFLIAILVILIVMCLFSCVRTPQQAQRKINRLVSRYPSLIQQKVDTVEVIKLIERISLEIQQDTIGFDSLLELYVEVLQREKEDRERLELEGRYRPQDEISESIKKELRKGSLVKTIGTYEDSAKGISFSYIFDPSGKTPFTINNLQTKHQEITKTETVKAEITFLEHIKKYWWTYLIFAFVTSFMTAILKK